MADNRQRIDENTARINAITERLEKSRFADVSDTTATATSVAKGKVFYDKDGVRTEGIADLVVKLTGYYEVDMPDFYTFSSAFETSKKDLFLSLYVSGWYIYKFDKANHTFVQIMKIPNGTTHWYEDAKGNVFYFDGNNLLIYDETTNTFIKAYTWATNAFYVSSFVYIPVDEDNLFFSNTTSNGLYKFDYSTKKATAVSTTLRGLGTNPYSAYLGFGGEKFRQNRKFPSYARCGDKVYFGGSTYTEGVYCYDGTSLQQVISSGYFTSVFAYGNAVFATRSNSSTVGLYKINAEDNTYERVINQGYCYLPLAYSNNGVLISSPMRESSGINDGLWMYNDNGEFIQLSSEQYHCFSVYYNFPNKGITLLSGKNTGSNNIFGVWILKDDNTITHPLQNYTYVSAVEIDNTIYFTEHGNYAETTYRLNDDLSYTQLSSSFNNSKFNKSYGESLKFDNKMYVIDNSANMSRFDFNTNSYISISQVNSSLYRILFDKNISIVKNVLGFAYKVENDKLIDDGLKSYPKIGKYYQNLSVSILSDGSSVEFVKGSYSAVYSNFAVSQSDKKVLYVED